MEVKSHLITQGGTGEHLQEIVCGFKGIVHPNIIILSSFIYLDNEFLFFSISLD